MRHHTSHTRSERRGSRQDLVQERVLPVGYRRPVRAARGVRVREELLLRASAVAGVHVAGARVLSHGVCHEARNVGADLILIS